MTQTFDLNKMGLAPMDEVEMQGVDGGGWWAFAVAYVVIEAAMNPSAHIKAFMEGWNSVK